MLVPLWNRVTLRYVALAAILLFVLHASFSLTHEHNPLPRLKTAFSNLKGGDPSSDIFNRTLGFEKVFAIGLPARTDKRDITALASSLSEFDITWLPGVLFRDMDAKAIPDGWDMDPAIQGSEKEAFIGSWRAHMDALVHIVENNIQTALILEDDADWDITIKQQFSHFATGAKALQELRSNRTAPSDSAYGRDWDVLWLGHRKVGPDNARQPVYVLTNDTTVPPVDVRHGYWRQSHVPTEAGADNTRLIVRTRFSSGTFAYAVNLRSALKIVAALQVNTQPYDIALSQMCHENYIKPFDCYAPYPPLMATHRAAGSASRDSDIHTVAAATAQMHEESTWDVVYSVMQNVKTLLAGDRWVKSQWPKQTAPGRWADDILQVQGRVEWMDFENMQEKHIKNINGEEKKPAAGSSCETE
ncbi:uncharacterized protein HMPREF1541_09579 [Cyphellophora europaea CBS 101466]|uniref:LPS glycosyltransferase n=1 Tax=Cyphellophora europaea (strain CBS 101466) TaxID=1220924 RepID=W2SAI9_CYPE1|nr:uncharacterized protein HMPREF1541_09579 [Cyphellophora europaea CBS 101466]ETN45746.1 hypothetical protein HMPREF1541_09579 [Cyphellophora europaea CBS 101466]